ncbi:hypothetical protein ACO1MI_13735, partial [Staphylococcus aureus]
IINQNIILSLLIITALLPLALFGVLGLAAVVLVHEIAEVVVILNGLRAARTRKTIACPCRTSPRQSAKTVRAHGRRRGEPLASPWSWPC